LVLLFPPGKQMTAKKRPWTEKDVRRLRLLVDASISVDGIAKSLGRSRASVKLKAHWLNLALAQQAKLSAPSERLKQHEKQPAPARRENEATPASGRMLGSSQMPYRPIYGKYTIRGHVLHRKLRMSSLSFPLISVRKIQ